MRIMLLCEGDAENVTGSFSGISKNIVDNLRLAGDEVTCFDCDLLGWRRYLGALRTFEANRKRWTSRFRFGPVGFRMRTKVARGHFESRAQQPDVILQFGATFDAPADHNVPYFLYCDSNIRVSERGAHTGYSSASPLTRAEINQIAERERRVYEGATRIFTLSEYLRASFIDDFGMPPEKVRAVGAGPNLDIDDLPLREPTADPTILFVGAAFERKGGDLLFAAFRRVRERLPNARLIMIGPERVETDIPGVETLGFLRKNVPEELALLRRAYATSTVFCLPTRFEPFGIVYLEAMFNRMPCIGPDAWAVPEMVVNGRTGLTFPPEDVDALTDRLLRLLQNQEEAHRLGEGGRVYAETKFTWPNVVGAMREEFAKALGSRDGLSAVTR
jgi:glycosyltransferase involved in cell wall biosynthesis